MPGRRFWLLAASLALPGFGLAEPAPAPAEPAPKKDPASVDNAFKAPPALEGESFSSEDDGKIIIAKQARFSTKDAQLNADEIRMNTTNGTIEAIGNVVYTAENLRMFGEYALIDSRTGRITARNVRFGRKPAYFTADTFTMIKGNQDMEGVKVWYREPSDAGMSLRAVSMSYKKSDDRIVLNHIHPAVGSIPFFYIPRYAQRGYREIPAEVYFRVRTSSRQGAYIRTTTTIRQSESLWAGLLLDGYTRAGWLIGPTVRYDNWTLPTTETRWRTNLSGGWINDHTDLSLYPDKYGRVASSDRYFIEGRLNARGASGWEMTGELVALSDPEVVRDYRPNLTQETQLPQTFLELSAPIAGGFVSALATVKTDNFQDVVQRLPELRLDFSDRPIGDSSWLGRFNFAAAQLSERPSEQLNGADFQNATGQSTRIDLSRLDTYVGLSRPTTFGDWLTVKPIAGVRSTWWSESTTGTGAVSRTVAQIGFDAEMLSTATWDTQSARWGIDGIRHTVRPFVQWRAMPSSGDSLDNIPKIDRLSLATVNVPIVDVADRPDIETLEERQVAQFGIRNTLETRDATVGTRELLRLDVFSDWRDGIDSATGNSSGIYSHVAWKPKPWLSMESMLKFDGSLGNHLGSATWMSINSGDLWEASLGLSDLSETVAARQIFGHYTIRLNSAYSFRLSSTYDLINGRFIDRSAILAQKIGNSWDLEYGINERSSSRGDGALNFSIRVRLFKF